MLTRVCNSNETHPASILNVPTRLVVLLHIPRGQERERERERESDCVYVAIRKKETLNNTEMHNVV